MRGKLPILLLALVAALYLAVLAGSPAPMDWRPDYRGDSRLPLGGEVLRTLLPAWLAPAGRGPVAVVDVDGPPYLHLGEARGDTTYVFVTLFFGPDDEEARRLLAHAAGGATVFIAAQEITGALADSLGAPPVLAKVGEGQGLESAWRSRTVSPGDSTLGLEAPGLRRRGGYRFPYPVGDWYFRGLDPARTTVLATARPDAGEATPVVVEVRHGRGRFVLASVPEAFANAALVGADGRPTDGPAFVAGVLSYLPARPAFWDEHAKPRGGDAQTPLRHVLREPALRWAYLLTLLGVGLFLVFRGRRWQRAVPVVAPPPNAAVEFVRTVGRLYAQHADHRALVQRKARHFFDRLRARYGVDLAGVDLSEAAERRAAQRAGVSPETAAEAFGLLRRLTTPVRVEGADLVRLDRALDRFFREAERA